MTDVIYAIQVAIAVLVSLWIYDRLAKRWTATLGDDVVTGTVTSVGYVASEGGGYISVSYAYSVKGTRFYGALGGIPQRLRGASLLFSGLTRGALVT